MNDEPSPRPWRVNSVTGGHISDANGDPVCFCIGSNCGERAALIVDAVNERDSLRDIVRRLAEYADAVTGYRPRTIEILSSDHPAWTFDGAALLREARSAIGEDKP